MKTTIIFSFFFCFFQIFYESSFLEKFSGDAFAAESYINRSLETLKSYYKKESFGNTIDIEIIGNLEYEDINISIEDNKADFLLDITLEKKESAHIAVYYVGEPMQKTNGKTTMGIAGCIGCICRANRPVLSRGDWTPRGSDPNFKHCIVAKTAKESNQGKVSTYSYLPNISVVLNKHVVWKIPLD